MYVCSGSRGPSSPSAFHDYDIPIRTIGGMYAPTVGHDADDVMSTGYGFEVREESFAGGGAGAPTFTSNRLRSMGIAKADVDVRLPSHAHDGTLPCIDFFFLALLHVHFMHMHIKFPHFFLLSSLFSLLSSLVSLPTAASLFIPSSLLPLPSSHCCLSLHFFVRDLRLPRSLCRICPLRTCSIVVLDAVALVYPS